MLCVSDSLFDPLTVHLFNSQNNFMALVTRLVDAAYLNYWQLAHL